MNKILLAAAAGTLLACGACTPSGEIKIKISNPSDIDRSAEIVEIDARVLPADNGCGWTILDSDGNSLRGQLTHDSLLIFRADCPAGASTVYTIRANGTAADAAEPAEHLACGRVYPERADDLAWENELQGFRIYGPTTQRRGERAYGYDIFFKHRNDSPVLERLYGPETDAANWRKVDSLRAIDPAMADAFRDSFSYHIDHGLGMDCYAVGPTLGDGLAAPLAADSTLCFPWCYESVEVLDNGPLRFTARLDFAPRAIGADSLVAEHRIISLDAGSRLNRCLVWYDGLTAPQTVIAAGFPRRDDAPAGFTDCFITGSDPTQGPDNGRALLAVLRPDGFDCSFEAAGHVLATKSIAPADTLSYYWGFAWDREDIATPEQWQQYLSDFAAAKKQPLEVEVF